MPKIKRILSGIQPLSKMIRYRLPVQKDTVALTFDDGPHPIYTEKVLEILANHSATATFFLLGNACLQYPELVRNIIAAGHAIGIHGMDHSSRNIVRQVQQCCNALTKLGMHTKAFRPPRGQLPAISFCGLALRGYTTFIWSHDRRDSLRAEGKWMNTVAPICSIRAGDIILMHDDNDVCLKELPEILNHLEKRGLKTCRLGE